MDSLQNLRLNTGIASSLFDIHKKKGPDYWSFEGNSKRNGAHSLISYPAMMVPSLQGHLIDIISKEVTVNHILDPFVGSGTILTEAMSRNIEFTGIDINPLAILACRVKSTCYFVAALKIKHESLCKRINASNQKGCRKFPGVEKWFHTQTAKELETISRAIRKETSLWARRVFWLAMGRTVRQVSNSRLSTYKLHKRSTQELGLYRCAIDEFAKQCKSVIKSINEQHLSLKHAQLIERGRYTGVTNTFIGDAKTILAKESRSFDLIMTSPPYGDNQTTIPYGQFSYLPLHWIDLKDIDPGLDESLIQNTHYIDSQSLGGSMRHSLDKSEYLAEYYKSTRPIIEKLRSKPNGLKRFATFFFDLQETVIKLCESTSNGGCHSWTVGNRQINNQIVPMNEILIEVLDYNGLRTIATIDRQIKNKKMAPRNNIANTMNDETIVIAQKRV
mgnify:CR=1 FL=1|tara:strand:+ start:1126 stop:2463 length:1338 start_codon:yes stop_codon:yes gene_type:complete